MWDAVVIVGCYAFACGFLRLLGGVGAAEDAIRRWGASESRRRSPELLDKLHRRGVGNGA